MAISTTCSLNIHTPPPNTRHLSPAKTAHFTAWNGDERSWRKRCVLGVTGMIMALEMGNWAAGETAAGAIEAPVAVDLRSEILKWSDERRMCPQWRPNSLETLMPEKLPRPFARRRWEAVGLSQTAPNLHGHSRCFSL